MLRYFGKTLGKESVLTASVPQKPEALSSAVCMNIDQRALENGAAGDNNDSPTYGVFHNPTSARSEVSCCQKNKPPSSIVVEILIKGVSVQMILKMNTMEYKAWKLRAMIMLATMVIQ